MQYFQTTAFIIETAYLLSFQIFILLSTLRMWLDRHWTKSSNRQLIISTIISLAGFFLLLIYLTSPHLKDLPILISGDHKTIKGFVHTRSLGRNLIEQVSIGSSDTYFFLESGAEDNKRYIVTYLPHSKTGIAIEKYDGTPVKIGIVSVIFLVFFILIFVFCIYAFLFIP